MRRSRATRSDTPSVLGIGMEWFAPGYEAMPAPLRRRTYMLVVSILAGSSAFLLGAPPFFVFHHSAVMGVVAIVSGVLGLGALRLLRRGVDSDIVGLAGHGTAVVGQTLFQLLGWTGHGPALIIYPVLVMMASVTLSRRVYRGYTVAVLIVVVILFVLDLTGLHVPGPDTTSMLKTGYAVNTVFAVLLTGFVADRARESYLDEVEERARSDRRLRLAVKGAKVGVWEWCPEERRATISAVMAELLSVAPERAEELDGFVLAEDVLTTEEFMRLRDHHRHVVETGEEVGAEIRVGDGEQTRWLHMDLTAEYDELGDRVTVIGAARDVTRERLELERRSEFIAAMSHELRTPLNGVLGMAELMNDGELPARYQRRLQVILESGNHLLDTIDQVLEYERIEAGALTFLDERVDIRKLVASLLRMFAPMANAKALRLSGWVATEVPEALNVDRVRLSQIVVNLLGNALKYTADGFVRLCVRFSGDALRWEVTDSGVGIPEDQLQRIFAPFERVVSGLRTARGGQGLGLAISVRLAEQLGGSLVVDSVINKGTLFCLTLPLEASPRVPEPLLDRTHALVVCECPDNADVIVGTIKEHGGRALWVERVEGRDAELDELDDVNVCYVTTRAPEGTIAALRARWSPTLIAVVHPADETPMWADGELGYPVGQVDVLRETRLHVNGVARPTTGPQASGGIKLATRFPLQILLVEDDPINQMVAVGMLEREGYIVDVADGGAQAVEMSSARPYDLIVMDLHMPEVDGIAATRAIRARATPQRPSIVAYTADADATTRRQVWEVGADGILLKPARPAQLADLLEAAYSGELCAEAELWDGRR